MDFLQLAQKRHSVRKYRMQSVAADILQRILEAGRLAPTAANFQPQCHALASSCGIINLSNLYQGVSRKAGFLLVFLSF